MCQLLGMNCNVPTDIVFSFTGFQARGGLTDIHTDGWGIAFFEGLGVRRFLDPTPSAHSPVANFIRNYPIKSKNVVAHIRKATQGRIALENTHPFERELWGHYWVYAHNGNIPGFTHSSHGSIRAVGDTDSENTFCELLIRLRSRFGDKRPDDTRLFEAVHEYALDLGAKGEFNFLLSNGEFLFAHCSTNLAYIVRQAPFSHAVLKDQDVSVDFSSVTSAKDRVAVIATTPLTDNEKWTILPPGTLCLFREGDIVRRESTIAGPKKDKSANASNC